MSALDGGNARYTYDALYRLVNSGPDRLGASWRGSPQRLLIGDESRASFPIPRPTPGPERESA